jgi:hypothetical protein
MAENSAGLTPHGVSGKPLLGSDAEKSQKKTLSVTVAEQLLGLMTQVTKDEVSPRTVNAACNCATAIHKFISLNLKLSKGA